VDEVSFALPARGRLAVIGPNGAGKTTLFNLISGELPVTGGSIALAGSDITALPAHRRVELGLRRTYQITNLFPALTIEQNLMLALYGIRPAKLAFWWPVRRAGALVDRAAQALDSVGLAGKGQMLVRELSHGEQRQLELALALAYEPRVLLLDEPGAGLSSAERVSIARIIRELPAELSLVLIEHDMDLALSLVDYVLCLHNGRIIGQGTPDDIRRDAAVQEVYLGAPAA
jgi:branched-chain amino acid transport system ATP-binding protein